MSVYGFIAPALSLAGPAALTLVVMRCFPHVTRAVVVLLAGIVAIVTRKPERREACQNVLDTLTRRDNEPPRKLDP